MTKQGEWKKGIWVPMVKNPKGYNKHKKNRTPQIEEPEVITQEDVANAYRNLLVAKRAQLSAAQKYSRLNKLFLGLDKIDKEFRNVEV